MTARRPGDAPAPVHSDAGHGAITTELVRLTLGGRGPRRPELRVDVLGQLFYAVRQVAAAGKRVLDAIAGAQEPPRRARWTRAR